MKTIITISLFIGIMNSVYSQDYLPIPESNSKWINTYSELVPEPYPHFEISNIVSYCTSGIDTIVNGLSYFIIDTCDSGYKGALRNENGKVWFLPKNSQTEFLLYDFTAQPGDTIMNVYIEAFGSSYELYDLYVGPEAIDSILIDGKLLISVKINKSLLLLTVIKKHVHSFLICPSFKLLRFQYFGTDYYLCANTLLSEGWFLKLLHYQQFDEYLNDNIGLKYLVLSYYQ